MMTNNQEQETSEAIERTPTLVDAWQRFAVYDLNAESAQKRFLRLRRTILIMGVVSTILAIVHQLLTTNETAWVMNFRDILRYLVILAPITVSVLLAGSVKFTPGLNYILLRGSAEAIKREIYRYRSRSGLYSLANEEQTGETRETKLARKVKSIGERLMKTTVNQRGLIPYTKPDLPPTYEAEAVDDGFSNLTPDTYLERRLGDQLDWYRRKARGLDRDLQRWQWAIYIFGGIGTFLAAVNLNLEIWIAVTNGIVTAIAAYIAMRNIETTMTSYNQAATDLEGIRMWWHSLSEEDRDDPLNFDKLVENAELVFKNELAGWVQEMTDVLSELYKETEEQDQESA